jgi:hypothetical protein
MLAIHFVSSKPFSIIDFYIILFFILHRFPLFSANGAVATAEVYRQVRNYTAIINWRAGRSVHGRCCGLFFEPPWLSKALPLNTDRHITSLSPPVKLLYSFVSSLCLFSSVTIFSARGSFEQHFSRHFYPYV